MSKDAIVDFADQTGGRRKPHLREMLNDEQIEQIKYAREQGVTWPAIAQYFKTEYNLDYSTNAFRALIT